MLKSDIKSCPSTTDPLLTMLDAPLVTSCDTSLLRDCVDHPADCNNSPFENVTRFPMINIPMYRVSTYNHDKKITKLLRGAQDNLLNRFVGVPAFQIHCMQLSDVCANKLKY